MKNTIYRAASIVICLLVLTTIKAQTTDYYTGKTEIKGSCYDYKVTKRTSIFIIGSTKNTKFRTIQIWTDGTPIAADQTTYRAHFIDKTQAISAFKEVFTPEEISAIRTIKGLSIDICYIVGVNGDVLEVEFVFKDFPQLLSIHPDKYYALEQKVKQKVKFWVEERYHVLGYIQLKASTIEFDSL
jgi:hypothetical protein